MPATLFVNIAASPNPAIVRSCPFRSTMVSETNGDVLPVQTVSFVKDMVSIGPMPMTESAVFVNGRSSE